MSRKTYNELLRENDSLKRRIRRLEKENHNLRSLNDEDCHKDLSNYPELKVIEDNINIAIARLDLQYRIKYANKIYAKTIGLSRNKIIGRHLKEILGDKNFTIAKKYLGEVKKGKESSYINRFDFHNNPLWAKVNYVPEVDDKGKIKGIIVFAYDITESKIAEMELQASESLLKKVQKVARLGSYVFDITEGKWSSSETLDDIFGITKNYSKNVEGWLKILHPDDKDEMSDYLLNNVSKRKNRFEKEYRIIKYSDHQERWVFGMGELEFSLNGKTVRMIGTIQDITDRKLAEISLAKSEELYKKLLSTLPDPIIRTNLDGEIIFVNDQIFPESGFKNPAEIIGRNMFSFVSPVDKQKAIGNAKIMFKQNLGPIEYKLEFPNGNNLDCEINGDVLRTPEGQPYGMVYTIRNITERKLAEEKIRESAEKYRALSEASFDAVFISEKGICLEVNSTARELSGYTDKDLIGRNLLDFILPDQREIVRSKIVSEAEGTYEIDIRKKDGSILPAMARIKMMSYKGKQVRFTSLTDITQRKKWEEQLRLNEMYLYKAEEVAKIGNWILDLDDMMIRASKGARAIYGVKEKEMPLHKVQKLSLEEYRPFLAEARKNLIDKGEKYDVEFKIRNFSTGEIVDIRSKAEYDPQNNIIFGVVQDITEQKKAVEMIREREKFLEALVDNLPAVVFVKEAQNLSFTGLNKAGEQLLGYSFEELKGKTDHDIYPKDMADFFYITDRKILKHKTLEDVTQETIITRNGTYKTVQTRKIPLLDNNGTPQFILGISEDITARLEFEKELFKTKEEAEKSNRLKSEFLAQMSHEIRSPISTILNFVSLIKMRLSDNTDEELMTCFGGIDSSSKRVIRTIDMILNMSEIQTGTYEKKPTKLNLITNIFENLKKEFSGVAERKGLKLHIQRTKKDIVFIADEYSVMQIFANLLDNAIKYTKSGRVEVRFRENKNKIIVIVRDTGIGISKQYLPCLFDAFSQEEQGYTRNFEGNGLGLALVKKYCEMNNAVINVESNKGKGTIFEVAFNI